MKLSLRSVRSTISECLGSGATMQLELKLLGWLRRWEAGLKAFPIDTTNSTTGALVQTAHHLSGSLDSTTHKVSWLLSSKKSLVSTQLTNGHLIRLRQNAMYRRTWSRTTMDALRSNYHRSLKVFSSTDYSSKVLDGTSLLPVDTWRTRLEKRCIPTSQLSMWPLSQQWSFRTGTLTPSKSPLS